MLSRIADGSLLQRHLCYDSICLRPLQQATYRFARSISTGTSNIILWKDIFRTP